MEPIEMMMGFFLVDLAVFVCGIMGGYLELVGWRLG